MTAGAGMGAESGLVAGGEILAIRDLHSGYGRQPVLHGVDLALRRSEIVALVGSNGSGKSTLLASITQRATIFSGEVAFDGDSIVGERPWRLVRRGVAIAPQGFGVFPNLTVSEHFALAGAAAERDSEGRAVDEVLEIFPALADRREVVAGTLSGGQRQMLAIARALCARPSLLILDEPSIGLAPNAARAVMEGVVHARDRLGLSVLVAEQNLALAGEFADRYYLLRVGEVARTGPVDGGFLEIVTAELLT